jgi:histone H3
MKRSDLTVVLPEVKVEEPPAPSAPEPKRRQKRRRELPPAIPVASFYRLVREISQDRKSDIRWQADALKALQADTEANLTGLFDRANKVRRLCKSKTLRVDHWQQGASA